MRDEGRKAQVISNAIATTQAKGLPADDIADLWDRQIEASIGYALKAFDQR